jgi:hypothetical protein
MVARFTQPYVTYSTTWKQLSLSIVLTTLTTANTTRLPHTTGTAPGFTISYFTVQSSYEETLYGSGDRSAVGPTQSTLTVFTYGKPQREFAGTVEYEALAVDYFTTSLKTATEDAIGGPAFVTQGTAYYYIEAFDANPPPRQALIDRSHATPPVWQLYGKTGVKNGTGVGIYYDITQSVTFVEQASGPRNVGIILPATNKSYTANTSGLTWTTLSGSSQTTASSGISAIGQGRSALKSMRGGDGFFSTRPAVIGGVLTDHESAVQGIKSGLYRDQIGQTHFYTGGASSYTGAESTETMWLHPKHWYGYDPQNMQDVIVEQRNQESLPPDA